ncbi:AzlD domain-containing protein [Pseudomonas vanderleydeniana]|uniref:AzlD domain-containing protein n=1 Tax=Pseudomonas vanderleydeniana TaxID=2745495 RepID=A0A9E6PR91_9PSED|nr:AzlD domain-containing protein [Pseudomonas vanderleydeniana]QXI30775.1 AzlD domain-containing protein [Pseudomonas vanderleydeniana]
MNSDLALWGVFLAVGVGTFALRLCFIEIHGRWRIPSLLSRSLRYVPASVLAALVLPAVVYPAGHGEFVLNNPQMPAAIIAAGVAWFTRSTLLTLGVGMAALWAFKYLVASV